MGKIVTVSCNDLIDEQALATVLPKLDTTRRARVERLQDAQKRAQCAVSGLLLTHLFGQDGQAPLLTHGSRGKPYLMQPQAPYFNLSHSGDRIFCAVSDYEVGLDAQTFTPYREKVAARWFTPDEQEWLATDPDNRFAPLWAKKEAYCKFTGFGLVLPPSSFTVPCVADGWDKQNHCYWKEFLFPADTPIAVAVCCGDNDNFNEILEIPLSDIR